MRQRALLLLAAGVATVTLATGPARTPPLVRAPMAANGDEWFDLQRQYPSYRPAPSSALAIAAAAWREPLHSAKCWG